jgi:hypothetical protein
VATGSGDSVHHDLAGHQQPFHRRPYSSTGGTGILGHCRAPGRIGLRPRFRVPLGIRLPIPE